MSLSKSSTGFCRKGAGRSLSGSPKKQKVSDGKHHHAGGPTLQSTPLSPGPAQCASVFTLMSAAQLNKKLLLRFSHMMLPKVCHVISQALRSVPGWYSRRAFLPADVVSVCDCTNCSHNSINITHLINCRMTYIHLKQTYCQCWMWRLTHLAQDSSYRFILCRGWSCPVSCFPTIHPHYHMPVHPR